MWGPKQGHPTALDAGGVLVPRVHVKKASVLPLSPLEETPGAPGTQKRAGPRRAVGPGSFSHLAGEGWADFLIRVECRNESRRSLYPTGGQIATAPAGTSVTPVRGAQGSRPRDLQDRMFDMSLCR